MLNAVRNECKQGEVRRMELDVLNAVHDGFYQNGVRALLVWSQGHIGI